MSIELDRRPTRFDSQVTKVNIDEDEGHTYASQHGSAEKLPRFSFNQGSVPDNPYNPVGRLVGVSLHDSQYLLSLNFQAPRRQSRIPNLKGPSPLPGSQLEFQEQVEFFRFSPNVFSAKKFGDIPWNCGDPHRYGAPKKGDSWNKCHKLTEKYDNEMCDAWKEEVDKLLIFVRDALTFLFTYSPIC